MPPDSSRRPGCARAPRRVRPGAAPRLSSSNSSACRGARLAARLVLAATETETTTAVEMEMGTAT
jgi:hypothetical protein